MRAYQKLTSEEQIVLGIAYLENSVSNQRLQQILDMHPTDIGKLLSDLVEKGILLSEWKGRLTNYVINKDYKPSAEQLDLSDLEINEPEFHNETDRLIYNYIKENGFITTKQVVAITSIGTPQGASVALKRMIDRGLVKKSGTGYKTYYELTEKN